MDNILDINFDVEKLSKEELYEALKIIRKNLFTINREQIITNKLGLNTEELDKQKKHLSRMLYNVRWQMFLKRDSC